MTRISNFFCCIMGLAGCQWPSRKLKLKIIIKRKKRSHGRILDFRKENLLYFCFNRCQSGDYYTCNIHRYTDIVFRKGLLTANSPELKKFMFPLEQSFHIFQANPYTAINSETRISNCCILGLAGCQWPTEVDTQTDRNFLLRLSRHRGWTINTWCLEK